MRELEDGKGVWQRNIGHPWNEYKLLQRDKFEELVQCMIDAYPDHELTEWLKRGFCMNEGDSTIAFKSLLGLRTLNHHLDRRLSLRCLDVVHGLQITLHPYLKSNQFLGLVRLKAHGYT